MGRGGVAVCSVP